MLKRTELKVNERLVEAGRPKAAEFYGDTAVWRKLSAMDGIDLIYGNSMGFTCYDG